MERTDPHVTGDELTLLSQFLDYHRATLVQKVSGLDRQQLGTRLGPSELTLAGLVKHMALNEDSWFGNVLLGRMEEEPWASVDWDADPDWEFHTAADTVINDVDPEHLGTAWFGDPVTMRWVLLHMIEETARHNGHADLLRENIDGVTGE